MKLSIVTVGILTAALASAQHGFFGPGEYEVMNVKSSRMMALDRDGRAIIQIVSRSRQNQRWDVDPAARGAFFIRSVVDGCALQISNGDKSTPVECGRFDRSPAQQWRIEPGKDGNPLIISLATGRVLDVPGGSNREGLRWQTYDRNGDSNQRFVFNRVPDRQQREDHGGRGDRRNDR